MNPNATLLLLVLVSENQVGRQTHVHVHAMNDHGGWLGIHAGILSRRAS
jgi:hypothetical protein